MRDESVPMPGWRLRARLIVRDMVTFDPARLNWSLGLRGVLGLGLPLVLGHALGQPLFLWVALGAFLLTIGDCTDDGDRAQPVRILVGAGLGTLALASGVLAGGSLATAVGGTLVWGALTGMLGVYGNAFATMSLPIAWAYVQLGLPAADHSLADALLLCGLFGLGGVLALLLALTLSFGGPFAPVRAQTAACYRELAGYLGARREGVDPPEARVRGAIAEARRRAREARREARGPSRVNQRAVVLIEIADRLFSLMAAARETGEAAPPGCRDTLLAIARALAGHASPDELRRLRAGMDAVSPGHGMFARRMAEELSHALSVAADDELPVLPDAPVAATTRLAALLEPLRANLDRNSVTARHALRFAVVTAVAVAVGWFLPGPFGYWVPLTATVVLRPSVGMTVARAIQRALGTVVGILAGLALMPLLPSLALQFAAVMVLFFALMTVLTINYSLAVVLLSAGIIPFEHVLTPGLHAQIGADRIVATAIGAALALVGGHLLWPTFERRALPDLLRTCTHTMSSYADAVLAAAEGNAAGDMLAGRRAASLALSNLQAAAQRSLNEIGGDAVGMSAVLRSATALQQISIALTALRLAAPALAPTRPPLAAFRAAFVPALADPGREGRGDALRAAIPAAGASPEAELLAQALTRLASALETLHAAATPGAPEPAS